MVYSYSVVVLNNDDSSKNYMVDLDEDAIFTSVDGATRAGAGVAVSELRKLEAGTDATGCVTVQERGREYEAFYLLEFHIRVVA